MAHPPLAVRVLCAVVRVVAEQCATRLLRPLRHVHLLLGLLWRSASGARCRRSARRACAGHCTFTYDERANSEQCSASGLLFTSLEFSSVHSPVLFAVVTAGSRLRARVRPRRVVALAVVVGAAVRGAPVALVAGGGTQPTTGTRTYPACAQRSQRLPAKPSRQRHAPLFASHSASNEPTASHAHSEKRRGEERRHQHVQ